MLKKPCSASYGRIFLGAFVPVAEPDLGCGDGMLGGELAEKRPSSTPPERL
jgi:hypothetical protein